MSDGGLTYKRVNVVVDGVAFEVAEAVADEIERLKLPHHAKYVEHDWEQLRQRAEAAEAEVERLRGLVHNSVALVTHEQLRQRAEAAEATVKLLQHLEWRCGHSIGLACCYQCFEAMQHKLFTAETAEKMWRDDHQRAIAKLAKAQQREAWWGHLASIWKPGGLETSRDEDDRIRELRRLLGLDDAAREGGGE